MNPHHDHYRTLGLSPSAAEAEIAEAVQRLCDEAAILVYTSPQRSHELWEQARRIRDELLYDPDRRAAYDRSLLLGTGAEIDGPTTAATGPREVALLVDTREWFWPALLSGVGAALAIVIFALVLIRSHVPGAPAQLALSLSTTGAEHRGAYISDHRIRLHWSPVPHALVYRLQVAAATQDPSDATVFRHPLLTRLSLGTSYSLKVYGPRLYYWRVQAFVGNGWSGYTRSQHFAVVAPAQRPPASHPPAARVALLAPVTHHAGVHKEANRKVSHSRPVVVAAVAAAPSHRSTFTSIGRTTSVYRVTAAPTTPRVEVRVHAAVPPATPRQALPATSPRAAAPPPRTSPRPVPPVKPPSHRRAPTPPVRKAPSPPPTSAPPPTTPPPPPPPPAPAPPAPVSVSPPLITYSPPPPTATRSSATFPVTPRQPAPVSTTSAPPPAASASPPPGTTSATSPPPPVRHRRHHGHKHDPDDPNGNDGQGDD